MDVVLYRQRELMGAETSDNTHITNMQEAGYVARESIEGFPGASPEKLAAYSSWFGWHVRPTPAGTPEEVAADLAAARPHFDCDFVWCKAG